MGWVAMVVGAMGAWAVAQVGGMRVGRGGVCWGAGQLQGPADIESCSGWPNKLQWLLSTTRAPCRVGPGPATERVGLVSSQKIVIRVGLTDHVLYGHLYAQEL